MLTGEALLQAILEDPEDDTPRLVYADWLEENGQAERAEFIRAECFLEQMYAADPQARRLREHLLQFLPQSCWDEAFDLDPRAWDLRQRAGALRLEYGGKWFAAIAKLVNQWYTTRRGFVHQIALPVPQLLAHAQELFHLAPVRELWLSDTYRNLPALAGCPHLEKVFALSFAQELLSDAGVRKLFTSPHLANLRELDLYHDRISQKGVQALAAAPLRRLSKLNLRSNQLGDPAARALANADHLTELTDLDLGMNYLTSEGAEMLAGATHFTKLRRLRLNLNSLGPRGCRALASAPHLAGLESLSLGNNVLGSEGMRHLAEGRWPRLAVLDLDTTRIGDAGVQVLASSPAFARLEILSLNSNNLSNAAAKALVSSPHLNRLTCLDLICNQISRYWRRKLRDRFGRDFRRF